MVGGPVTTGNGLQAGKKSALTGILMTSFAAFGALLSILAPRCCRCCCRSSIQSLTLTLPIRRVCVFDDGLARFHPHPIVTVSSSDMTPVSYLVSRK